MKQITVIGSTNVDMLMALDQLPQKGETVTNGSFAQTFGGKGANQAVAAARAGGNTLFITHLGNDIYVDTILKNFREDNICTDHIYKTNEINSGMALVMFDQNGDNYLAVSPGSNYLLSPDKIEECESIIAKSSILILQMEIPIESNLKCFELARKYKIPVIFNLAPARAFEAGWLPYIDYFVVNEIEAYMASGIKVNSPETAKKAGEKLLSFGCKNVIITLGEKGAYATTGNKEYYVPAFKVNAVDATAAGDTFCGTLAVALTENKEMDEAVRFASAASALTVTKKGAQPSIPYRNEINRFLNKY